MANTLLSPHLRAFEMKHHLLIKKARSLMNRIQHNDFKMYTPPGVSSILTTFCLQHSIFKSPVYDFFKYIYITSHITTFSQYQKTNRESCTLNIETLSKILGTKNGETTRMIKNLVKLDIIKKVRDHEIGVKSATYTLTVEAPVWEAVIALPQYTLIPLKIISKRNELRLNPGNDLKMYKKFLSSITVDIPAD